MTRRISAVAVCCSNATLRSVLRASSSLKRRTFSMAMTAWSAKVLSSSTCVLAKGPGSPPATQIAPMTWPSRGIGTESRFRLPMLPTETDGGRRNVRVVLEIRDMDDGPLQDATCDEAVPTRAHRIDALNLLERRRRKVMVRRELDDLPVKTHHGAVERPAEGDRAPGDRVEDGLDVRLRLADDLENVAGRCLLVERLCQRGIPRLEFLEQAHVRDRDDRLVGKGLEERVLLVRERLRLASSGADDADGASVLQHRNQQNSPVSGGPRHLQRHRGHAPVVLHVADVDDRPLQNHAGHQAVRVRRDRIGAPELLEPFRTHLIMAHEMDEMAVESKHGGQETIAESSRAVHDRIED